MEGCGRGVVLLFLCDNETSKVCSLRRFSRSGRRKTVVYLFVSFSVH